MSVLEKRLGLLKSNLIDAESLVGDLLEELDNSDLVNAGGAKLRRLAREFGAVCRRIRTEERGGGSDGV